MVPEPADLIPADSVGSSWLEDGGNGAVTKAGANSSRHTLIRSTDPESTTFDRLAASHRAPSHTNPTNLFLQFAGKVLLGEILEILVRQRVNSCRATRQHTFDFLLPGRLLEPLVVQSSLARVTSFSLSLIPTLRGNSYRSGSALDSPMNFALGMAMRWLSNAN